MKISRMMVVASASALVLGLAGCWGDNSDDTVVVAPPGATPSKELPDSAGLSAAVFVSYLLTLRASDELSEPLTLKDGFTVPPDDSAEPTPLV